MQFRFTQQKRKKQVAVEKNIEKHKKLQPAALTTNKI